MTTFLYSIVLTSGSDKMAVSDPHGWTLTIVSVAVVFAALLILWGIYCLIGALTVKAEKKAQMAEMKKSDAPAETEMDPGVETAIAAALALYLGVGSHDVEPGIITIADNGSPWRDKALLFRRNPIRK